MRVQKAAHTLPGLLARSRIIDLGALLIEKAVLRLIAEELVVRPCRFESHFERIDRLWRTPIVLISKMALQWDGNAFRISGFNGWNTIKTHPGVEFRDLDPGDEGQRSTHAKTHDSCPTPTCLQVLHCPAHVLFRGAYPVEPSHEMVRFVRLGGDPPLIQIRRQRIKARGREAIAHPTDLIVESPPLLDDHDMFCTASGCGQITGDTPTLRGFVLHGLAHMGVLPLWHLLPAPAPDPCAKSQEAYAGRYIGACNCMLIIEPRTTLARVEGKDGTKHKKIMPEQPDLQGHYSGTDVVPGPLAALASRSRCTTPALDPWTWCRPESVRGCGPAPQCGTARRPSQRTDVQKTSQTLHHHAPWLWHAGGSCPGWTSASLCPTSTADDHP